MNFKWMMMFLLLLETVQITYSATLEANKLIRDICDTLGKNNSLQVDEDHQWHKICQELFHSKDGDQNRAEEHDDIDEQDSSQNKQLRKAVSRGGIRGGGIRGGSGSRASSSGSRASSSITRYHNTRTGTTISRPNGWQWSRSRLIFLPLATRFAHRSRSSSSSRFTTPSTGSNNYYYCTSTVNPSVEIQCSSADGDAQCCEDETSQEAFCCGGSIPDDILQDMNRATQRIAGILYTLAAVALSMHLFMRRFYR